VKQVRPGAGAERLFREMNLQCKACEVAIRDRLSPQVGADEVVRNSASGARPLSI
jgi:hypothetical protein